MNYSKMDVTVKEEPLDMDNVPEPDYCRSSNSAINNSSKCLNLPPIVVQVDRVQVDSDIEMDSHSTNAINCIKDECPSNPSTSNSELESEDEDDNDAFEPIDEPSNSRFVSDMRLMKHQLKCPFCVAPPIRDRRNLDMHLLTHFNCLIYACPDCTNKRYVRLCSLFHHRKTSHQDFNCDARQMKWNRNCPFCDAQSFASKAQLVRHLVQKHRSEAIIKDNSRFKAGNQHIKSSSNTGRNTISFCPHPKETPSESINNVKGVTKFECSICKLRSFATISERSLHVISHFNIDPYKCPYCPLRGSQLQQLYSHRARYHPHTTVNSINNQKSVHVFGGKCEFCPYSFANPKVLSQHVLGKHVALLSDSQREYYQSHANPNLVEGTKQPPYSYFHCPSCDIRFSASSLLADHLIEDHGGSQSIDTAQSVQPQPSPSNPERSLIAVRSFTTSLQSQTPNPKLPAAGKSKSADVRRCRDCAAEFESLELFMSHKKMSRWFNCRRIDSRKAVHKLLTECSVHKLVCRETQLPIDLELIDIKPDIDNPICDSSEQFELPAKINEQLSAIKFASMQKYGDRRVRNEQILIECPMCPGRYTLTQIYNHFGIDQSKPTNHHQELPSEESSASSNEKMEGLENEMLIPKSEDSVDPSMSATQTKCNLTIKLEPE